MKPKVKFATGVLIFIFLLSFELVVIEGALSDPLLEYFGTVYGRGIFLIIILLVTYGVLSTLSEKFYRTNNDSNEEPI